MEFERRSPSRIADQVIAHLVALPGATVEAILEVQVKVSDGVEDDVVRAVTENATALKFDPASFVKDLNARPSAIRAVPPRLIGGHHLSPLGVVDRGDSSHLLKAV